VFFVPFVDKKNFRETSFVFFVPFVDKKTLAKNMAANGFPVRGKVLGAS